jgi:hypothetical protein
MLGKELSLLTVSTPCSTATNPVDYRRLIMICRETRQITWRSNKI